MTTRTNYLLELFRGVNHSLLTGADVPITGIAYDSRKVSRGDLFFAVPGEKTNGSLYVHDAVEAGAAAVVTQKTPDELPRVPVILTEDVRAAMASASNAFFGCPSSQLRLFGVTGTNGKTSVTHIIRHFLASSGSPTALIGTLGYDLVSENVSGVLTTPESPDVNAMLSSSVNSGIRNAILEVSSHSLVLKRVADLEFDFAVFTNLSQDHLDFHGNFKRYRAAKSILFEDLSSDAVALLNADDPASDYFAGKTPAEVAYYSTSDETADYYATNLKSDALGIGFSLRNATDTIEFRAPLVGSFNIYNLLAGVSICAMAGLDIEEMAATAATLEQIPGRMERVAPESGYVILVDYSHTPDALSKAIDAARNLRRGDEKIISLFGCGGDRDSGKRSIMGAVASEKSDQVIVTSDNPRNEDPGAIISEIIRGVKRGSLVRVVEDRREAISLALEIAEPGDFVLVCGKGHEDYQEIRGVRRHFSDVEVVREVLESRGEI